MTIKQLKEYLGKFDENLPIAFVHHDIVDRGTPLEPDEFEETTIGDFFEEDCLNQDKKFVLVHLYWLQGEGDIGIE